MKQNKTPLIKCCNTQQQEENFNFSNDTLPNGKDLFKRTLRFEIEKYCNQHV